MHVLLIPGEELNSTDKLSSIFELQQAAALAEQDVKIGFVSIRIAGSIAHITKTNFAKPFALIRKVFNALFNSKQKVIRHEVEGFSVYEGQVFSMGSASLSYNTKVKAGLRAFALYLKEHGRPDLIHAHSRFLEGGLIALAIKKKYRLPYIITEHSSCYARDFLTEKEIALTKTVLDNASSWIAVSPQLGKLIRSMVRPEKSFVYIPNVLDKIFEQKFTLHNHSNSPFTFLHIGSLDENKAQDILIRAFDDAFKGKSSFRLKIGGTGEKEEELKKLTAASGVNSQVDFLGKLNRQQVLEEIKQCDVFVLSSRYETFGVVLIEAMSCGKPVIATNSGGPVNIINKDNGLLAEPNSWESLSDAMKQMAHTYHSYNPELIRESCLANYRSDIIAEQLITEYKKILA